MKCAVAIFSLLAADGHARSLRRMQPDDPTGWGELNSDMDLLSAGPGKVASGATSPDSDTSAPADGEKDREAWTIIDADSVDDGSTSLGAVIDEKGRVVLQAADAAGGKQAAWGSFSDSLDSTGWCGVSMHTSEAPGPDDGQKMYAAGVIEGFLTAERIREFHDNSRGLVDMNPANHDRLPKLQQGLQGMVDRLAESARNPQDGGDTFSAQVRLGLMQTWGIRDGYAQATKKSSRLQQAGAKPLSMVDLFILNSDGVIDELLTAYGGPENGASLLQKSSRKRRQIGHCTGLVHLADSNQELYFGHTTWESFSEMTRFWKVYDFPVQGAAARKISFSSYPACVSSTDDYYLTDSGLAITETTLSIPNDQQYSQSASTPDFLRIMASNRVATNGQEWTQSMSDSATGTYSSQWMVVDYKKFKRGQDLESGTFHVLEQSPGVNHAEDMSSWLQQKRYWSSYDRAYFDDTRAATGDDTAMRDAQGTPNAEIFSKDNTPRAQIVRATEGGVNSLDAMRAEMTRNKGTDEPVDKKALQIPRFAISARNDLKDNDGNPDKQYGSPDGGVDAKVTSSCLFESQAAEAISSPSHTSLPAFKWTENGNELWPGYPHEGLPNEASFDWQSMSAQDDVVGPLDGGACA